MAFVNAAMVQPPPPETSIIRRRGNHHPNLWKDSFIQSLSSPYSASSYHERRETLTEEITGLLSELVKAVPKPTADNLHERFRIVDVVQRLGIGRHFEKETKLVLDYSYKCWKEEAITLDLNTTALGFRTLRLNGYHVSADVFNIFKDENGQFFCPVATEESHCELRSMLNLHRASEIVFPGETIMKEINVFTSKYLQHALKESELGQNQLIMEVENALKYPWRCNVPRLEARNYIEIFRQDNTSNFSKKHWSFNQKLLELAILDFNILQGQHQRELKQVSSWWKDTRVSQLEFFRHRHVEFYFWCASGLFEAEFGASRILFSKLCSMFTLLNDIYDTYGTLDELKPFTAALISREISTIENLPDYMKISFKFVLETLADFENEVEKLQGHNPDVKRYVQDRWENYILAYFEDAKWIASNYIPTLDEYFKYSVSSTGLYFLTMCSLLVMDNILSDKIFKELDIPSSKFQTLTPIIARLVDDIQDFEEQQSRGENASTFSCFKRDNPQSTFEDAFNYMNNLLELYMEDVTREFLESYNIMVSYKNLYFNAAIRGLFFIYKDRDGLSFSDKEMKNAINNILIEPIGM